MTIPRPKRTAAITASLLALGGFVLSAAPAGAGTPTVGQVFQLVELGSIRQDARAESNQNADWTFLDKTGTLFTNASGQADAVDGNAEAHNSASEVVVNGSTYAGATQTATAYAESHSGNGSVESGSASASNSLSGVSVNLHAQNG